MLSVSTSFFSFSFFSFFFFFFSPVFSAFLLAVILAEFNMELQIAVGSAGPQQRAPDCSGQRRTSTGWLWSGLGNAGPHPGSSRAKWAAPDLSYQKICQTICQKRMSERMSEDMSEEMSEDMSIEMSDNMSEICQRECRKKCQKKYQKICQKYVRQECQKVCQ